MNEVINEQFGTVTFVLGLAGSGKTYLIKNLVHDGCVIEERFALDCKYHNHLASELKKGKRCIISEQQLMLSDCRDKYIKKLKNDVGKHFYINWICFENDPTSANINCLARKDEEKESYDPYGNRHVDMNNEWTSRYTYPAGATIVKVYRQPNIATQTTVESTSTPPPQHPQVITTP